jgi:hypothetical protein
MSRQKLLQVTGILPSIYKYLAYEQEPG